MVPVVAWISSLYGGVVPVVEKEVDMEPIALMVRMVLPVESMRVMVMGVAAALLTGELEMDEMERLAVVPVGLAEKEETRMVRSPTVMVLLGFCTSSMVSTM